jgi:hypothetical protein
MMTYTDVGLALICAFLLAFVSLIGYSESNLEDSTCSKKVVENGISTDLFLTEGGW